MAGSASSRLDFTLSLIDRITTPLQKVENSFSNLGKRGQESIKMVAVGFGGLWASFKGISELTTPAREFNAALADAKAFGVAETSLDRLGKASLNFISSYGGNAEQFIASAKDINGAMQGLSASQLANITTISNTLAKATASDAATVGQYMKTLYRAYSTQADTMGRTKWAEMVASQSALAVKTYNMTTSQLLAAFNEAGNMANRAGVSFAEQLSIYGTLGANMDAGKAGGIAKSLFENVNNAGAKLGLSFNDANGRLMSTVDIIGKLNGKFGDLSLSKNTQAIRDAFGGEAAEGVMVLMKNIDQLQGGIKKLGNIHGMEQLAKLAKDMTDPWQQFNGAVRASRTAFGRALLPILTPVMEKLTGIAQTLQRWTQIFPNITRVVGKVAIGFLLLTAATSAFTFVFGVLKTSVIGVTLVCKGFLVIINLLRSAIIKQTAAVLFQVTKFLIVKGVYLAIATAQGVWTAAQWVFNAALWACPLTWIIVAIIAVVAAIGLAIYYWKDISNFLTETFSTAIDWVMGKLNDISDWFNSVGGWTGIFKSVINGIVNMLLGMVNKVIEYLNYLPGVKITKLAIEPIFDDGKLNATVPKQFANVASNDGQVVQDLKGAGVLQNNSKSFHVDKVEVKTQNAPTPSDIEQALTMAF